MFNENVIFIISKIPVGKVLTYGIIATLAGIPGGARQVTWILHSQSKKHNLPWHRVINAKGKISLQIPEAYIRQKELLENEGIILSDKDKIDLKHYLWNIKSIENI